MQFYKDRHVEAYAPDLWDRNGPIINLDAGRILFQQRYHLYENVYYIYYIIKVFGLMNYFF